MAVRDHIEFVTGWLCLNCQHTSPAGDAPDDCCTDRAAMRVGFRPSPVAARLLKPPEPRGTRREGGRR
jgi:hypothetical protein